MKSMLIKNQLWTGIAFIFLGILLWVLGLDRVMLPAVGKVNVDVMFISVGVVLTVRGFYQKKKQ